MVGYIFETKNLKTGETYLGKRYAVTFDKNFFGEEAEPAVEKYGRSSFEVKMLAPFETIAKLDEAFEGLNKSNKPAKKAKVEDIESEEVIEEKPAPRKKRNTKTVEEE